MANKNYLEEMIDSYCHPSVVLWRAIELKTITNLFDKEKIILQNPILDLGCGNGRLLGALQEKKINYTGVDFSGELIKRAIENFPNGNFGRQVPRKPRLAYVSVGR